MATQIGGFSIGNKVYFGRTYGEQTYGEVVGLARTKLKIKQLEERGMHRTRPAGTIWTVPPELCRHAAGAPVTVPAPQPAVAPKAVDLDFARKAVSLGLPADCFGKTVTLQGRSVKIVGIETRRPAYPVSVEGPQGGRYKVTVAMVLAALGTSTPAAPRAKRSSDEIMRDIMGVYCGLSPENLFMDGEISHSQGMRRAVGIRSRMRDLFQEIGRSVSETEADQWWINTRRLTAV